MSLANGESARVKVKRDSSGQVVLYGGSFEQFIHRYHLNQDYRMEFQNDGGKQFLVRIGDTQGVEIEYEMRVIDNNRWFQSKKKGTPPSFCKMFGEQEAVEGYLALQGILGKHFPNFTRQEVFLLVGNGSRWAIETRAFNDGTIRLLASFYLRVVDMDGIEIGYEVAARMNQKKDVSTSAGRRETSTHNDFTIIDGSESESDSNEFDDLEASEMELVIDEATRNAQSPSIQIHYYNGFLIGDTFGEDGKPGFLKTITTAICIRLQPIYIPRSFVRMHLLSKGKSTVELMRIGDGEEVKCNIRWGGASNPDDAYIPGGIPLLMNLVQPDVGQTVLFSLVDWEEVESLVTFVI
ncbi:hypothetical protein ACFE04_005004 [Oxalis oulophora]